MFSTVTIIGAGQAGLAASRCLTDLSIDHVVLERGETANSWRRERWDSLRLLTPNWLSRLPSWRYTGDQPDEFMSAADLADYLGEYSKSFDAPVQSRTSVESVSVRDEGFTVTTSQGVITSNAVVVATGASSRPHVPAIASLLPSSTCQLAPIHYRNPAQLEQGRVLVVGASASGAQIADELARFGHDVTLAVGTHTRLPRTYRGLDIHTWLDSTGILDDGWNDVDDIAKERRASSLQLVGSEERRDVGLNALSDAGVDLVGRLVGVSGNRAQFSGSLAHTITSADLKLNRLLERFDEHANDRGIVLGEPYRPPATTVPAPQLELDLRTVRTVIWATGFRPTYPWLPPEVLDRGGAVQHDGGVMPIPGMYVLGLPFARRRKSAFIDGVGPDATELMAHLAGHLNGIKSSTHLG